MPYGLELLDLARTHDCQLPPSPLAYLKRIILFAGSPVRPHRTHRVQRFNAEHLVSYHNLVSLETTAFTLVATSSELSHSSPLIVGETLIVANGLSSQDPKARTANEDFSPSPHLFLLLTPWGSYAILQRCFNYVALGTYNLGRNMNERCCVFAV